MPYKSACFLSQSEMWETPKELFNQLNAEFGFTLDVCATAENAKCKQYYTKEQDGLSKPWAGVVWCNPPYGRQVGQWVQKAAEAAENGAVVVMLLPARTDTQWFHKYIYIKSHWPVSDFLKVGYTLAEQKQPRRFPPWWLFSERRREKASV